MLISERKLRRIIRSVLKETVSRRGTSVHDFLKSEGVLDINPKYASKFNLLLRKYKNCIPKKVISDLHYDFSQGYKKEIEAKLSPYVDVCVRQLFNSTESEMSRAFSNKSSAIFPDEQSSKPSPDMFYLDDL